MGGRAQGWQRRVRHLPHRRCCMLRGRQPPARQPAHSPAQLPAAQSCPCACLCEPLPRPPNRQNLADTAARPVPASAFAQRRSITPRAPPPPPPPHARPSSLPSCRRHSALHARRTPLGCVCPPPTLPSSQQPCPRTATSPSRGQHASQRALGPTNGWSRQSSASTCQRPT